ncbi:DUF5682 family protein [Mycobacterium talmoniae]|uniref:DUF5682 family protein n=1 Tax=Mycobacterium talmoniae TaxID=1858794 RepID=UPI002417F04D|nr:DUF5682 family protein [Mycobacterium talmoniae]
MEVSRDPTERWRLTDPPTRLPALIEAGAWGATLVDAARNRWAATLAAPGLGVAGLATALDRAAAAGLDTVQTEVLTRLRANVAAEADLGALGEALRVLLPLARHPQVLGLTDLPAVRATVAAITDRALWLLEPPAPVAPADVEGHLRLVIGLRDLIRAGDTDADAIRPDRIVAVLDRKARCAQSDPASRGAALGALISVADTVAAPAELPSPVQVLGSVNTARLGDALAGLLALAREELTVAEDFLVGLDALIRGLGDADFVGALPALRAAFGWLPPRERGELAEAVLALHGATGLSRRSLTGRLALDPQVLAAAAAAEHAAVARLQPWDVLT